MSEFEKRMEHMQNLIAKPDNIISMFYEHDDRTTAIMVGGFLEDLLALGIIAKFKVDPSDKQLTEMFTGYGPLSNLSSKIALGQLLGIIGVNSKHDFNIIRKIRNEFAHVIEPISFETKEIADRCRSLKLRAVINAKHEARAGNGARGAFIKSGMQILAYLLLHAQLALEERKLITKHQPELKKAAIAVFQKSMKGKMPATFAEK